MLWVADGLALDCQGCDRDDVADLDLRTWRISPPRAPSSDPARDLEIPTPYGPKQIPVGASADGAIVVWADNTGVWMAPREQLDHPHLRSRIGALPKELWPLHFRLAPIGASGVLIAHERRVGLIDRHGRFSWLLEVPRGGTAYRDSRWGELPYDVEAWRAVGLPDGKGIVVTVAASFATMGYRRTQEFLCEAPLDVGSDDSANLDAGLP